MRAECTELPLAYQKDIFVSVCVCEISVLCYLNISLMVFMSEINTI